MIDGPGHGASQAPSGPITSAACGAAIREVLDAVGEQQPVVVVGTSWRGLAAGEFAPSFPQRTAAVVMPNTPVHKDADGPSFADRFATWGARWINGTQHYSNGATRAFFLPQTRERDGEPLLRFHAHLHAASGDAPSVAVHSVLIEREALAPRLAQIQAPTLFVAGTQDAM